ncbi:unnamed protein product [Onchocerca flexuosa]|uniref:C2H2-type domain-containing protein n=1 Tax=Onchocerca flexuosa TaxID=387005 RepID=A0A183H6A9_9BILA|nr:unnamed protein product [Onchocerca flexuosa]
MSTLGASGPVITGQRTYLLGNINNSRNSSSSSRRQIDTMNMSKNYDTSIGNSYHSQQHSVPMRSSFRSSSTTERKSNRSSSKKEPMDPKNVEEEVARNVSQILSASLNQKSLSSGLLSSLQKSHLSNSSTGFASTTGGSGSTAQSFSSTTGASALSATTAKKSFTCVDCHKTVSTSRNLQRHRMSCKLAQASSNPEKSLTGAGQLQATVITMPLNSTQINGLSNTYSAARRSMSSATTSSISSTGIAPATNIVPISYNNNLITSFADVTDVSSVSNQRTTQIYSTASEMNVSDERVLKIGFIFTLSAGSYIRVFKIFWGFCAHVRLIELGPVCEDSYLDKAVAEMTRNGDLNTMAAGSIA